MHCTTDGSDYTGRARRRIALRGLGWLLIIAFIVVAGGTPVQAGAGTAGAATQPVGTSTAQAFVDLSIYPFAFPDARAGEPYALDVIGLNGVPPYTFRILDGALPDGLTLSSDGAISGIPTTVGQHGFFLGVSDVERNNGGQFYAITVRSPIAVSPGALIEGKVGSFYRQQLDASGGVAPYTYSVQDGVLPPGITLSANGILSGTPTNTGYWFINLAATDTRGIRGIGSYTLYIAPAVVIAPFSLPFGQVGVVYDQDLIASGNVAPYAFTVGSGVLPPGLTLSQTGRLSGTPSSEGMFNFDITATSATGATGTQHFSLSVANVPLNISPESLPEGKIGETYRQRLTISNGITPYRFTLYDGTLPQGITLNLDGTLSGKPLEAGFFSFIVAASDARGRTGIRYYGLSITRALLTITPVSLPKATIGTLYRQRLAASGGRSPYTFAIVSGLLPPGLSLRSDGRIEGRPTAEGPYPVLIGITDGRGNVADQHYTIEVAQAIEIDPYFLPSGHAATPYQQTLGSSGGKAPYSYAITEGVLPQGMSFTSSGVLSGTPMRPGFFGFVATSTDAAGLTGKRYYSLSIYSPIAVSPPSLLNGRVGIPFTQSFAASGGTGPYTFAVSQGTLPPGLSLSPSGLLSGTPTAEGAFYSFTVTATDSRGISADQSYSLGITQALVIMPFFVTPATLDQPFELQFQALGGAAPYSFTITEGLLPDGLLLEHDGLFHGTPTRVDYFAFRVLVTDTLGLTGQTLYIQEVRTPQISVTPESFPAGRVGDTYDVQLTASGGTAPYTFFAANLPSGLQLTLDGHLFGIPRSPGEYFFAIYIVDARGTFTELSPTIQILPLAISPETITYGFFGQPYSQQFSTVGGVGPIRFFTRSTLPSGMTLSRDGLLSGTPRSGGSYYIDVVAVDANGRVGIQTYGLLITTPLQITTTALPEASTGSNYITHINANGGQAPYTFTVVEGELPPGLNLASYGMFEGVPTVAGAYTFTIELRDTLDLTMSQQFTIVVN